VPLTGSKVSSLEPNVSCFAGLNFPSTSVVDVLGLCHSLEADAQSLSPGSHVLTSARVISLSPDPEGGYDLTVRQGDAIYELTSSFVVNAAGLDAPSMYTELFDIPRGEGPRHYFCKGHYYGYQDRSIINSPVYPLPTKDGGGLGIHGTKTVDGDVVFGPNVEWMDEEVGIDGLTKSDGVEVRVRARDERGENRRRKGGNIRGGWREIRHEQLPLAGWLTEAKVTATPTNQLHDFR
jgi:L-2-hydroxyglutarate oxidase LhgO